ncbi:hypothetical protein V1460_31515 [Streptomyces sp. SCSIO 30461]|uniref:hypothetical protein n=1 Tax=Streptomyces sp. SCSIO 30461 TaxID=3118085 RepID=UPI0030CF974A
MPRPTAAQLAYGSATVVIATIAMLLLSRTTAGIGIAVIGIAALALGLLVAMTVPLPVPADTKAAHTMRPHRGAAVPGSAGGSRSAGTAAEPAAPVHSLRR